MRLSGDVHRRADFAKSCNLLSRARRASLPTGSGCEDARRASWQPQRDALKTIFGLSAGQVPDQLFVALAALGLLSEASEERPLLCVIDDAQWLDRASAQALVFVARRLRAEAVAMLFAAREPGTELQGLPELTARGLPAREA
jgi:hypothetical protein